MAKATRATRTPPTPADRIKKLRTDILKAKIALEPDDPNQLHLSQALQIIEYGLYGGAKQTTEIAGVAV